MFGFFKKLITIKKIHRICKKYGIKNYTINDDMSIDVNGNVNLYFRVLYKLPLKFNKVSGNFDCHSNQLTTLEGCPIEVGGYFSCWNNKLTSLEGCPIKVGGNFSCSNNQLTSLDTGPAFVNGKFSCGNNPISEEFYNKFNGDYNLYRKYLHRKEMLKQLIE